MGEGPTFREQAMAEKRAYLHKVAVEEADEELPGMWERADLVGGWSDADDVDSGSLSEDEERERSGRPR